MYKKISDYGIIGNLHSVALIGSDASIDWLCLPHIDSPSVFGALLDDKNGGRFSVSPLEEWDSVSEYITDTNILRTRFRTRSGIMQIIDFMPVPLGGEDELEEEEHELYRLVEIKNGKITIEMIFDPQFNYARSKTTLQKGKNFIKAKANDESIVLSSTHSINDLYGNNRFRWNLSEGERLWLHLRYGTEDLNEINPDKAEECLGQTQNFWQSWLRKSDTGKTVNLGPYQKMIDRSALVLKLLYYDPTGTIAAAATTSLPEEIGGIRNWDYRYSWIRDTSFTLQALFKLGHISETEGYLRWIEGLLSEYGAGKMQIMYGLRGEEDLPEVKLLHLDGYKGSRPVRIGNKAAGQRQLDIYGEIMDAALKLSDYVGKISPDLWPFLRSICDYVVGHWYEKDNGIWEVRGGPYHFVYSKVMCWVALDRGITIAKRYGFQGDLKKWNETCLKIREEVQEKGWSEKRQSFVQHYDNDALDSSNLLIPIFGFLPFDDPRVISSINTLRRDLSRDGFLYRYLVEDGLQGKEGVFLLCTFWLINCLIELKRFEEAESLIHRMEGTANHLGLFPEEYDIVWDEALGNFPQAFTHIGYINSVLALREATAIKPDKSQKDKKPYSLGRFLLRKIVLNDGYPRSDIPTVEISKRLKNIMNVLRGSFFDTKHGRVAYETMKETEVFHEYIMLSYSLKKMDLSLLKSREEKIAFWINLYNVIVIHGVIELGIRDSVKEVRNFFKRIQYQINDMFFSPDDIEHGILRGNSRPPNALFKLFKETDKRLIHIISPIDPRIHFALVCASSSCPPIEVYTAENLEKELTIAAKTFVNSGGIRTDRKKNHVVFSRIFKWYASDFGQTQAEIIKSVSEYIYDTKDRKFLEERAEMVKIDYSDYDWRLNRYS